MQTNHTADKIRLENTNLRIRRRGGVVVHVAAGAASAMTVVLVAVLGKGWRGNRSQRKERKDEGRNPKAILEIDQA